MSALASFSLMRPKTIHTLYHGTHIAPRPTIHIIAHRPHCGRLSMPLHTLCTTARSPYHGTLPASWGGQSSASSSPTPEEMCAILISVSKTGNRRGSSLLVTQLAVGLTVNVGPSRGCTHSHGWPRKWMWTHHKNATKCLEREREI